MTREHRGSPILLNAIEISFDVPVAVDGMLHISNVFQAALADLSVISDGKAEVLELLSIKDNATDELKKIQETLRKLYIMLGEPKVWILDKYWITTVIK